MKKLPIVSCICCLVFLQVCIAAGQEEGRIYGVVRTTDGEELTGLIRWDKNEASWVDLLNGSKRIPSENIRAARDKYRERSADQDEGDSFFGIRVNRKRNRLSWSKSSVSGIRFGHVRSLEPTGSNRCVLVLKSGEEIEFSNGSTDIGNDIREIIVENVDRGEIGLQWRDIELVTFSENRRKDKSRFGERLYGTLVTRGGESFTGLVCWDVDEIFPGDILDGKERGRKRKIRFEQISKIERYSSKGATVTLRDGSEVVLRGSNDVDSGNRGIIISDPGFGQVTVRWRNFKRLTFSPNRARFKYRDFDGGKRLYGTAYDQSGRKYTGRIRWDNDEEWTWELLDGEADKITYDVEFGKIREIERTGPRYSKVTLLDGRTFELGGSNDVAKGNRGVFVESDRGDDVLIPWDEFDRIEFRKP